MISEQPRAILESRKVNIVFFIGEYSTNAIVGEVSLEELSFCLALKITEKILDWHGVRVEGHDPFNHFFFWTFWHVEKQYIKTCDAIPVFSIYEIDIGFLERYNSI